MVQRARPYVCTYLSPLTSYVVTTIPVVFLGCTKVIFPTGGSWYIMPPGLLNDLLCFR